MTKSNNRTLINYIKCLLIGILMGVDVTQYNKHCLTLTVKWKFHSLEIIIFWLSVKIYKILSSTRIKNFNCSLNKLFFLLTFLVNKNEFVLYSISCLKKIICSFLFCRININRWFNIYFLAFLTLIFITKDKRKNRNSLS